MRLKNYIISLFLICIFLANNLIAQNKKKTDKEQVQASWTNLTIREKIGQTIVEIIDYENSHNKKNESLEQVLNKYPVGAIFMANWLIKGGSDSAKMVIKRKISAYAKYSKIPILYQEDYETGLGENVTGYTQLPNLMALGATNNQIFANEFGNTLATEARQMGMSWLLNPVCDLNVNFLNPLVSTRSVSDNSEKVIRLVSQQLKAMQKKGVAATIKHFPGDGMDFRDQHQVTSMNSLSKEEWNNTFGKVFQALIDSGVYAVMAGHICLPAFQTKNKDGFYLPATLSPELLTGLLKGKMGFKGVVVSDALNMGGMAGYYDSPLDSQLEAFKAGCDMMLWPVPEYIDSLEAQIVSGRIPIQRLNDAVSRVWEMKRKCGLFKSDFKLFEEQNIESKNQGEKVAREIANASITLVRDVNKQLPLNTTNSKKILWVVVGTKSKSDDLIKKFQTSKLALENLGYTVEMRVNCPYYGSDLVALNKNDKIILAFDHHPHNPMGTTQLYEEEILTIWLAQMMPNNKLISISYGDPYCHNLYLPKLNTCINAYSDCPASQLAVIQTLVGKLEFNGISPVNLKIPNIEVRK